jgi:outer membrane phospholipase A
MKPIALLVPFLIAMPAAAQAAPRMIVGKIAPANEAGVARVEVVFLNDARETYTPPARIPAALLLGAARSPVMLDRAPGASALIVPPGGFASVQYDMPVPAGHASEGALAMSLDLAPEAGGAPDLRDAVPSTVPAQLAAPAGPEPSPAIVSAKEEHGNAFLGNISAYAPIYAVYGPGTDSDARLQLSLKYQLFGDPGAVGPGRPWENGIHLGYTQRMFWNLGADSSPFRSVDFMPELFYLIPARPVAGRVTIGGQAGFRHESNGRGGLDSRSLNTFYVQPVGTLPVGDYTVSVGPRIWAYTGSLEDNPDIKRYRGNTGLFAEIGQDDGFRLTTTSRINFNTGKGAFDAELSYPLDRLIESKLNLYLFGQAFAGYGENLFDYSRRVTRVRFGIGIVR